MWKNIKESTVFQTPYIQVIQRYLRNDSGEELDICFSRTAPAVIVFVCTADGGVLLQDQYVLAQEKRVVGCVAGYIDKGESPEEAAKRELQEESGYMAGRFISLGNSFAGKWAKTDYYFMLALDANPNGQTQLEPLEDIQTVLWSMEKCRAYVAGNPVIDTPTLVCMYKAFAYLDSHAI